MTPPLPLSPSQQESPSTGPPTAPAPPRGGKKAQGGGDRAPLNPYGWKEAAAGASVGRTLFRRMHSGIISPDTFDDKDAWGFVSTIMPPDVVDGLIKQINDYAAVKLFSNLKEKSGHPNLHWNESQAVNSRLLESK